MREAARLEICQRLAPAAGAAPPASRGRYALPLWCDAAAVAAVARQLEHFLRQRGAAKK
jgi:hypothetical protein